MLPRAPRPFAAACLALLALLGAGCGGDDVSAANAYVDRLNAANERFARTAGLLREAVTPSSTAREDRITLDRYARAVDRVVADLRSIPPPPEVRALHGRYVDVMAGYADAVDEAVAGLRSASAPGQADRAARGLREASARIDAEVNAAIAQINDRLGE